MLELFIPERFSAYRYIISKKILAISISREHVFIVLTKITDKKRIILHTNHKNISQDESIAYDIRVGNALEEIIEKLSYDKIIFLLPSSQVIFKNIQLPFKNIEQLKMIVPFEVAATLPFSIQDSSTDCIQTNIQENNSDVLVAIAKQEYINIYREIANNIDITINKITVDGFELASSFLEQKYLNNDNSLFVILDSDLITMLCFKKKQFLTIKTISHSEYETEFSETKNKNDFIE